MEDKLQNIKTLIQCLNYLNDNDSEILKLIIKDSFETTMLNLVSEYRKALYTEFYPN